MEVTIPFEPRQSQIEVYKSLKRFSVLVCHRRWGKTVLCINKLISAALKNQKERPRYAYIAPLYKQSKAVTWDYLKHYTGVIPGVKYNESELRVDLPNGARITLYGADNPDSLRGIYLDGVVLDEFAQMSPKMWSEVIRPALADRLGWAIFIGTPMGHNAFYELLEYAKSQPNWYAAVFKASETGIIAQAELIAARAIMNIDEYEQEFECSFEAAIQGAYYGEHIKQARDQGRISPCEIDLDIPVLTGWDLGRNDSNSIWFAQPYGRMIRLIDFDQRSGEGMKFYVSLLHEFHKTKGYKYGTFIFPHDIRVTDYSAEQSRLNIFLDTYRALFGRDADYKVIDAAKAGTTGVMDRIEATRFLFPRFHFNSLSEKVRFGVDAISQYRKEFDEDNRVFRLTPKHDWTSHTADALGMIAMGFEDTPEKVKEHYMRITQPRDAYDV